jgi:hypothetical protein
LEASLVFFEKADYFVGEGEQFSGVLLNSSLTTKLFPAFFSVAVRLIGPREEEAREILIRNNADSQVIDSVCVNVRRFVFALHFDVSANSSWANESI